MLPKSIFFLLLVIAAFAAMAFAPIPTTYVGTTVSAAISTADSVAISSASPVYAKCCTHDVISRKNGNKTEYKAKGKNGMVPCSTCSHSWTTKEQADFDKSCCETNCT